MYNGWFKILQCPYCGCFFPVKSEDAATVKMMKRKRDDGTIEKIPVCGRDDGEWFYIPICPECKEKRERMNSV